eukprot:3623790-Rhodomonas_salina.1
MQEYQPVAIKLRVGAYLPSPPPPSRPRRAHTSGSTTPHVSTAHPSDATRRRIPMPVPHTEPHAQRHHTCTGLSTPKLSPQDHTKQHPHLPFQRKEKQKNAEMRVTKANFF